MFRNTYDTDVTTWSPEGRLYQIEYSTEVAKQGSAAIGLRSETHVVLACLKKANFSHQRDIFKVDDDIGVAFAGLTADGRVLTRYMRSAHEVCTQRSWKRPCGVDLLVAGLDESGAYLYYKCPSGNYFEYQAFAIGSRSQAAKTYLERKFENFSSSSRDDLIKDALFAIKETLQGEKLTSSVCTVSVVGVGESFTVLDQATVQALIDKFVIAGEAPVNKVVGDAGDALDEEAASMVINKFVIAGEEAPLNKVVGDAGAALEEEAASMDI